MLHEEAIKIMREIVSECAGLVLEQCVLLSSVVPVHPKTLDDYNHYEIRIRCMVDDDLKMCIDKVAVRHKLQTRLERNVLVIYRPFE
jgi:hypothetical protein